MNIDTTAFVDELEKISEAQDFMTRERAVRALKGALVAGGGYGLGWGLGNLAMDSRIPERIRTAVPNPKVLGIGGAGLSLLAAMANKNLRKQFLSYVRAGDKKQQDFSMGHDKLNPEHRGAQ